MHSLPVETLDVHLSRFFVSVRKVDGSEYEPCSIKSVQSSLSRYLKEKSYERCIIKDREFFKSREALRSKCRDLKSQGRGNKPMKKRAPTSDEVKQMWSTGALGDGCPESLQMTMWWILSTRFGKRAVKEQHQMRWGDLKLGKNSEGHEFLQLVERQTKTRTGENIHDVNDPIRVYADGTEYCPIQLYKEYKRRRPVSELSPESRLFLQPKKFSTKPETGTKVWYKSATVWYKSQAHGKNSLEKYMRVLCDMAGLPKDISLSNISARKHLVTTCKAAGVPDSTTIKVKNASQMYT